MTKLLRVAKQLVFAASLRVAYTAVRMHIGLTARLHGYYHPMRLDRPEQWSRRNIDATRQRWLAIADHLRTFPVRSFVDLGAANGYFVRMAAREGMLALGIENNPRYVFGAESLRCMRGEKGAGFLYADINLKLIKCLPKVDAVSCLSLFHHIVRLEGYDVAVEMLRELRLRTNVAFFYEIEPIIDSTITITGDVMLREAGFRNVQPIASTPGWDGDTMRSLYVAEPV